MNILFIFALAIIALVIIKAFLRRTDSFFGGKERKRLEKYGRKSYQLERSDEIRDQWLKDGLCPACGVPDEWNGSNCGRCSHKDGETISPPPDDLSGDQHGIETENQGGLRRRGKFLVAAIYAPFPDRCVKCNLPAEGYRINRKLISPDDSVIFPRSPSLILLLFCFPIFIISIIASALKPTRASASIAFGLCPAHRRTRRNTILIGWCTALALVGSYALAVDSGRTIFMSIFHFILTSSPILAIYCFIRLRLLSLYAESFSRDFVWIRGAGKNFLESLQNRDADA
jgi:hypothetical protein